MYLYLGLPTSFRQHSVESPLSARASENGASDVSARPVPAGSRISARPVSSQELSALPSLATGGTAPAQFLRSSADQERYASISPSDAFPGRARAAAIRVSSRASSLRTNSSRRVPAPRPVDAAFASSRRLLCRRAPDPSASA